MAPAFMALTVIGMSPWPVMKMIGTRISALANSVWKSRPLKPGSLTSSTRQHGTSASLLRRNSAAEANTSACNPTDWNRRRIAHGSVVVDDKHHGLRLVLWHHWPPVVLALGRAT